MTWKNPADTAKTAVITDKLPEGMTFVSAENDGTYDETTNTITWTANLASGKSQTVSFLVTVDKTADCDFIQNVAKVHVDETDADSNPVKVYVKGDKSTDPENQDPKDDPNPDDQKPDDGKPADDPKTDDGTPSDDPKTEDTTPTDDDKTPSDDTKKQDDQKPVIKPTETEDKKDTTTPTQDSSKSDDDTKKPTVKDNTGSNDDSGKGQSTPGSDGKGQSTQTTAPKTGDEANVTLWVVLMLAAVCAAGTSNESHKGPGGIPASAGSGEADKDECSQTNDPDEDSEEDLDG